MSEPIYLDAHATTPIDPRVLDEMLPWMRTPANSHSAHAMGRAASLAVEEARGQVAKLIGADAEEIVFVPSATIAANIALRSLGRPGTSAVRSAIEHPCVIETLAALEPGISVTEIAVDEDGLVNPDDVEAAMGSATSLVAVMAVNNEVGTVQPIAEIGRLCEYLDVPLFVDLAQAAGRTPLNVRAAHISAGALSSHKLYGPQGIGALYCRRDLLPMMRAIASGGGQERGLSPGTLPTALSVGFGASCRIALEKLEEERSCIGALRDRLFSRLRVALPGVEINGSLENRVAGNLNLSFPGIEAEELLAHMSGVIASTGSACSSGAMAPSPVLTAMGLPEGRIRGAVRFGIGRFTSQDEIDRAAALVIAAVNALSVDAAKT